MRPRTLKMCSHKKSFSRILKVIVDCRYDTTSLNVGMMTRFYDIGGVSESMKIEVLQHNKGALA